MDISAASVKTPEPETEAQTRIQPAKQLLTTNGVLKRHHLNPPPSAAAAAVVTYKECLKNHAATMGGHAVDGCGEFMPAPSFDPTNPTSLKCAACGCHRNFHRLDTDAPPPPPSSTHQIIEYKPHHRHHPPPPPPHHPPRGSPTKSNSASPPPISSSYMLLALSGGGGGGGGLSGVPPQESGRLINHSVSNPGGRKRFRTKFSQNQKEKMLQFAERVGWKMQRKDEDLISGFCAEIGVEKGVFKVWMHNNKSTFAKNNNINKLNHHHLLHHNNGNGVNFGNTATTVSSNFHNHQENNNNGSSQVSGHEEEGVVGNGSSSSS